MATDTVEAPVINDHDDVDNAVHEIYDELLRMSDFCELTQFDEATDSYDKVRVYMESIRTYLTQQTKDI